MSKPEITIPNKNNKERLNKLILELVLLPVIVSENKLEPRSIDDKIQIINNIIITAEEVDLSLKNPPG